MDLPDYCKILILLIIGIGPLNAQVTEVRCINPEFDNLVDEYLDDSVPTISVADAFEAKDKYLFLDAREKAEFDISHIEEALHIGYDNFNLTSVNYQIPKDTPIIIYCSIGYRSEKIGERLKKDGYTHVYNLYGSIFEWVNQHHPVVNQKGESTTKLHTYNSKWGKWVENDAIQKVH